MPATKTVRIRTATVGVNFGTIGVVVARNGRIIAETGTKPLGNTAAAIDAARDLATSRGWTVRE